MKRYFGQLFESVDVPFDVAITPLEEKITKIMKMSNEDILNGLFDDAIGTNFSSTIYNVYGKNRITEIELESKKPDPILDRHIKIIMIDETLQIESNLTFVSDFKEAIYIENPHIVRDTDKVSNEYDFLLDFDSRQRLAQLLTDGSDADYWDKQETNLVINNILKKISSCAPGNLVKDNPLTNSLVYEEENRRFDLINVSSGIKTFAILKKLLTDGKLKRNGMLILDEPEIHLHPEWQLVFVEVLMLLQKQFNLTILINTHSVYFLMAIEDYSKMHKIEENCNYYLIEREGNHSTCKDCTDILHEVYQHFAKPLSTLHNEVK